ncbi:hypothetical protein P9112_008622 [Eukaryota sp. TZLM1-RC]
MSPTIQVTVEGLVIGLKHKSCHYLDIVIFTSKHLSFMSGKIRSIQTLCEKELNIGVAGTSASYHEQYKTCPHVYVKFLHCDVVPASKEDIETVFSQFGNVRNVVIPRKPGSFFWITFSDPRSAVLAIENLIGYELFDHIVLIDHAPQFKERSRDNMDITPQTKRHRV